MESLKLKIVKSVVTEDLGYRRGCGERRLKPHQWGERSTFGHSTMKEVLTKDQGMGTGAGKTNWEAEPRRKWPVSRILMQ